jgi:hypothetical protein
VYEKLIDIIDYLEAFPPCLLNGLRNFRPRRPKIIAPLPDLSSEEAVGISSTNKANSGENTLKVLASG